MSGGSSPASLEPFIQKLSTASEQAPPADRSELVRLVVLLFTAVRTCQQAYLRYREQHTNETYASWHASISTLHTAIESLAATLHIFAPDVFVSVTEYYDIEAIAADRYWDKGLEYMNNLPQRAYDFESNTNRGRAPKAIGFDVVIGQLGRFIRENFSMEEVFRASST
jgi:hypothetical protein